MSNAQDIIDRIMRDERLRRSSHFSDRVYRDEPIITTGRQIAGYLPDRYREMRAISRWQPGEGESRGRWLSEAELFYRQGVFMQDFEDDCPYHGTFKSPYPTYNAMSDRQLRGYFTWRAAVRRGDVEETSLAFAFVYLYELLCGIGVQSPTDGLAKLKGFWDAYRAFAPEIDRYARAWLQDYVVYHGLDPQLIADQKGVAFDRALVELAQATEAACSHDAGLPHQRGEGKGALLPPDEQLEDRLLAAIDALSTYQVASSALYRDAPADLRHVACATYLQLSRYYAKHRKAGLIESLFGSRVSLPYTMFASAVFYAERPHPDTVFKLTPLATYTCSSGLWTSERVHGSRSRSEKLGEAMRAADRMLRAALGCTPPLQDEKIPRYLERIVAREIEAWLAWKQAHTPRRIDIDLSKLSGIRSAAEKTREALLIDEEREETGAGSPDAGQTPPAAEAAPGHDPASGPSDALAPAPAPPAGHASAPAPEEAPPSPASAPEPAPVRTTVAPPAPAAPMSAPAPGALTDEQAAYLAALLADDAPARAAAAADTSEDLLVDAINEAAFDLIGDTVIEFGEAGPAIVEDYRDDLEELLHA